MRSFLQRQQGWLVLAAVLGCWAAWVGSGCGRERPEPDEGRLSSVDLLAPPGPASSDRPATGGPPEVGDRVVISVTADPRTLNPLLLNDVKSFSVIYLIYEGLVDVDANMQLVPHLARAWEISPDGRTLTFYLRQQVRWHDGKPFTAHDVRFTFDAVRRADVVSTWRSVVEPVEQLEVVDDHTVRVHYAQPFAPALESWRMPIVPAHRFKDSPYSPRHSAATVVGTGPYRFVSWRPGQMLRLAAHAGYWSDGPFVEEVVFKTIPSHTIALKALRAGHVDVTELSPTQWDKQTLEPDFVRNFYRLSMPGLTYSYIGWNCQSMLFSDPRVRRAMTHALPRQQIVEELLHGLARITTGPFFVDSWAYDSHITPYSFSIAKARRLLAEAGWVDHDGDGILDRHGRAFRFSLLVRSTDRDQEHIATLLKYNLESLGIIVEVVALDYGALIERMARREFEAYVAGWMLAIDPDLYPILHSSQIGVGGNFVAYDNEEVDQLLERARVTFERAERMQLYHRVHEILHDAQPYTFLYTIPNLYAVSRRIRNIRSTPFQLFLYRPGLAEWYVPSAEQVYRQGDGAPGY